MTRRDLMDDVLPASDEPPGSLANESDVVAAAGETDITPESSDDDLLGALGDDVSRDVLLACSRTPVTAEGLAESYETSESTIYCQLGMLSDLGLVKRTRRVDTPSKTCYETAVDGLSTHLGDGLRVGAGSSNYIVDAMRTLLAAIDVRQLAYDRKQNSVGVRFRLVPTLLDSLVELYVRDTDSCEK